MKLSEVISRQPLRSNSLIVSPKFELDRRMLSVILMEGRRNRMRDFTRAFNDLEVSSMRW